MFISMFFKRMTFLFARSMAVFVLLFMVVTPALSDVKKKREVAKSDLNSGKIEKGYKSLLALSNNGDDESSFLLGYLHTKSKIKAIPRDVGLAEKYLLRGALNCHDKSLSAISAWVYKKRGSKLFNPSEANRLQKLCETKVTNNDEKNTPSVKQRPSPPSRTQKPASPPNDKKRGQAKITEKVRLAWLSEKPRNLDFYSGGSGVAINRNGVFLTNHHVIDECQKIGVIYNGMIGKGRVLFADESLDLAAVSVNAPTPHFATFDASSLRLGERLIALGYPAFNLFGSEPSISEGRLTNTSDEGSDIRKDGFLLVSLPIASGNSGGPVYNNRGLLRGLVSYGFDNDMLSEALEKDGKGAFIDTVTFSFIVSGLRVVDHLSKTNIQYSKTDSEKPRRDVEELAERGKLSLAAIACG